MAIYRLSQFSGIAPALSPRLLADDIAQTAENIDFESGRLVPTTTDLSHTTLSNSVRRSVAFYRGQYLLQWDEDGVKGVSSPIANDLYDRFYWTGEDYPRMGTDTTIRQGSVYPGSSYRLGVPAPSGAPGLTISGTAAADETPETQVYVYTLVTAYGEEGPPSTVSASVDRTSTETVTISMPSANNPSGNYNFGSGALKRIYRSNTGSQATAFQFLAEIPYANTTYADTTASANLGEVLPSNSWIGPPDDNSSLYPDGPMQGLISVGGGVFAGFSGNRLCFSEPYLPHAWPIEYRMTIDEPIVGLAATNNGVIVLTEGFPYFVTGTEPAAMVSVQVDVAQSCVNDKSIVDMGEYVLYAGPDGLVSVSNTTGEVVSNGMISAKQWNADFYPETIRAFFYEGTYVAFWEDSGAYGGWVFDPRATKNAFSTITVSAEVRGGISRPKDGKLYIIQGNDLLNYRSDTTAKTLTWKSKQFALGTPVSFGWVGVYAESYPVTVKVWADGTLLAEYSISKSSGTYTQTTTTPSGVSSTTMGEPLMRLPSVIGSVWEVQVSGDVIINEIVLASSAEEILATS